MGPHSWHCADAALAEISACAASCCLLVPGLPEEPVALASAVDVGQVVASASVLGDLPKLISSYFPPDWLLSPLISSRGCL